VFGRNLFNTGETNSILEISKTLYCPYLEVFKSSCFNVTDFLNLRVVTLLILMQVSLILFAVQTQEQKFYDSHCEIVH